MLTHREKARREWSRRLRRLLGRKVLPSELTNGVHWEVQRTDHFRVRQAMLRAVRNRGSGIPAVVMRDEHTDWLVTIRAEDVLDFANAVLGASCMTGE